MMVKLTAKIRKNKGRKTDLLRDSGRIPAVVYGYKIENILLDVDHKEFQKIYSGAGTNSLIELDVEGSNNSKGASKIVLIHDFQRDPVTDAFIHVDFFETSAKKEVEVKVPLVFEGVSVAIKDLGGTLVKNISEFHVKALPQNLPHEIKVSIDKLNTFEDHILVKDIVLPKDVKISAKPDEIVASVTPPAKVEEELAKEIKEEVENVEKVVKEKKTEDVVDEVPEGPKGKPPAPEKK